MAKSSSSRTSRKVPTRPGKPSPEFPLYPHPLGYWSKKVQGKLLHFGRWGRVVKGVVIPVEDGEAAWKEALSVYNSRVHDIQSGELAPAAVVPEKQEVADGYRVKDLCNDFLTAKLRSREAGELTARMFAEYKLTTDMIVVQFGGDRRVDALKPDDFAALRAAMVKRWGPLRVVNGITRTKSVFKFAYESGLLDRLPRYGQEFRPPSRSVLRRHRAKAPPKMLEPDQLRALIDAADVQLKAMILLGLNAGFGNGDCAALPLSAVNLDAGWIAFPRPKTGIERKCPLWPETVAAIREALAKRPKPAGFEDVDLVFLNYRGTAWVRMGEKSRSDYLSHAFNGLLKKLKQQRAGLSFYTLRHVFRTVADGARDIPAVRSIMGHVDAGIDVVYRERIDDDRLRAVAEHVRRWLCSDKSDKKP